MRATEALLAALVAVPLLAGCPRSNAGATDAYARQVTTATMRVAQLEAALVDAEARVTQLEEALRAQVEDDYTKLETLEQVNAEVSRIRGDIEVLRFELGEAQRMLDAMSLDQERRFLYAERRVEQLETFLGVKPPPPPTDEELGLVAAEGEDGEMDPGLTDEDGNPVEELSADEPVPEDIEGKLELAVSHMAEGRNTVARAVLMQAVEAHAGEDGMDEVRYRIAETWFNDEDWSRAITEYNKVIEGWPKSTWASWSMLAQADAFAAWGQPDNARLFYEEVVRTYPKSEAAKKAKARLSE